MRREFTACIYGKFHVTIPKSIRREYGIREAKGMVKLVMEDYFPPSQTEEHIVSEELEGIKREKNTAPTSREVKAKGEGALKKLMGA